MPKSKAQNALPKHYKLRSINVDFDSDYTIRQIYAEITLPNKEYNEGNSSYIKKTYTDSYPISLDDKNISRKVLIALTLFIVCGKVNQLSKSANISFKGISGTPAAVLYGSLHQLFSDIQRPPAWARKLFNDKTQLPKEFRRDLKNAALTNEEKREKKNYESALKLARKKLICVSFINHHFKKPKTENSGLDYIVQFNAEAESGFPFLGVYFDDTETPNTAIENKNPLSFSQLQKAAEELIPQNCRGETLFNKLKTFEVIKKIKEAEEKDQGSILEKLPEPLKAWSKKLLTDENWNQVQIPGSVSFPVTSLYTELELLEEQHRPECDLHPSPKIKISADAVLERIVKCGIIIGEPGSGKSTLVKWIAHKLMLNLEVKKQYPVVIQLRQYESLINKHSASSLIDYFLNWFCNCELPQGSFKRGDSFLGYLFKERSDISPVFLLDGWDELSAKAKSIIKPQLSEIANLGKIIITTRPAGRDPNLLGGNKSIFKIEALSHLEIRNLVNKYCVLMGKKDLCGKILEKIDDNFALQQFSSNPFNLTLICESLESNSLSDISFQKTADIFSNAVSKILSSQSDEDECPVLTRLNLDKLCEVAKDMCFSPNGKLIHDDIWSLGYKDPKAFKNSSIIRSKLISKESFSSTKFYFCHVQYQEYFAGKYLASLEIDENEFSTIIKNYGISWDYIEVWKFFAGNWNPDSHQSIVFTKFWKEKLKRPDLFGNLFCYLAEIYAEIPDVLREDLDFGCSICDRLWDNIVNGNSIKMNILAISKIDLQFLIRKASKRPESHILYNIISNIGMEALDRTNFNDIFNAQIENSRLSKILYARRFTSPCNLKKCRAMLRDAQLEKDTRLNAYEKISGYYDNDSLQDALSILDPKDEEMYELSIGMLYNKFRMQKSEPLLLEIFIDLLQDQTASYEKLITLSSIIGEFNLTNNSIKELINLIEIKDHDSPNNFLIIRSLSRSLIGEESMDLLELYKGSKNLSMRYFCSIILARCQCNEALIGFIENFRSIENRFKEIDILMSAIYSTYDCQGIFDVLYEKFKKTDISNEQADLIIGLSIGSQLDERQTLTFEKLIISNLNNLKKRRTCKGPVSTIEAVATISQKQQIEAFKMLCSIIDDKLQKSIIRGVSSIVVETFNPTVSVNYLLSLLDSFVKGEKNDFKFVNYHAKVVDLILEHEPKQIIERLVDERFRLVPIHGDISRWAEKKKAFCFDDGVVVRDDGPSISIMDQFFRTRGIKKIFL